MKSLNRFGLNKYETEAYLYLVKKGTTGAVNLAKKTGVPYGRIYDVLYQLESKGFVKVILDSPKQFAPIDPKKALDSAIKKKKDQLKKTIAQARKDQQELIKQYKIQKTKKTPSIWMVSGKKNIKEVRRREIVHAKEISAIISKEASTGYDPVLERLARESKVKRRFIENKKDKKTNEKIKGGAKVRFSNHTGFTLSITDNKAVRIEINDPNYGRTSVIIENKGLAKELGSYFEYKWNIL